MSGSTTTTTWLAAACDMNIGGTRPFHILPTNLPMLPLHREQSNNGAWG
jgi:hypothetical protein